ncbi:MAG: thioesterase family protein [Aureliella sp.]
MAQAPRIRLAFEDVSQLRPLYQTVIGEEHLDAMGHMNVMWYTHFFSEGMGTLLASVGLDWDKIRDHHGGTFALEGHVRFFSEVRVGQRVSVYARVIARSAKRYHVLQFMTNEDKQDVAAMYELVGAHVDLRQRRMAEMPKAVCDALDQEILVSEQLAWDAPLTGIMSP